MYFNCGERHEDMIDHRSCIHNFSSYETGFEPMNPAIPVQCSTNKGIKPTGSWSRRVRNILVDDEDTSQYMKDHIFELPRKI